MKVKLFSSSDYQDWHTCLLKIEKTINAWLTSHPAIAVQFITQSQDAGTDDTIGIIVITVWYEEGK